MTLASHPGVIYSLMNQKIHHRNDTNPNKQNARGELFLSKVMILESGVWTQTAKPINQAMDNFRTK